MEHCPLCNAEIDVDEEELDEGDSLICEECGAGLVVTGLKPLELEPDDDEDEKDDYSYDDDEEEEEEEETDRWS